MGITLESLNRGLSAHWRERLEEWPLPLPRFSVELKDTALMVIDMQYGSADPNFGLGPYLYKNFPAAAEYLYGRIRDVVIPNTQILLEFFRKAGRPIIYLTLGLLLPNGGDGLPLLRQIGNDLSKRMGTGPLVQKGSRENAVVQSIAPREGEIVLNKTSMGAFNSTGIDQTLRNIGTTTLVITGITTECCVATTARDAADRGFHVLLIEDACAGATPYLQESSLVTFAALFGRVATTADALTELAASSEIVPK